MTLGPIESQSTIYNFTNSSTVYPTKPEGQFSHYFSIVSTTKEKKRSSTKPRAMRATNIMGKGLRPNRRPSRTNMQRGKTV